MKIFVKFALFGLTALVALAPSLATAAAPKCTKLQSKNIMLPGKCVVKTAAKAGLALFKTKTCTTCHSASGSTCTVDLGTGSCSYKKMATLLKAANDTAGNKKSVPPTILIDQFNAYSAFMPGITPPNAADAKKYITYLSTLKQ